MGINEYLAAIKRRWRVVVAAGVLGVLIGLLIAPSAAQANYSATATVLQSADVKTPVAAAALLTTSNPVAERAAKLLSSRVPPKELLLLVVAAADKATNSIKITTTSADASTAAALANAFAVATVNEFRARRSAVAAARFTYLQGQLADVNNQLKGLVVPEGATRTTADPKLSALTARYSQIYGQLQDTSAQSTNVSGLELLSPATAMAPDAGIFSLSNAPTRSLLGLVLGLLLGGGLALVLEHFDTRINDRGVAGRAYGLPILAEIPIATPRELHDFAVVTSTQPESATAEAYRALRSSLTLTSRDSEGRAPRAPQVILVASARAAEGKTATVVNLAACFADIGKRVLVLDCDFRGPDAEQYLGVTPGAGLSDLLMHDTSADLASRVHPSDIPGVGVVTAGTQLDRPSALPARMGELVRQARQLADVVLIDSAPMLLANDATDLIPHVDTVLMVSYTGRVTLEQAQRAGELLARTRTPVVGVALIGGTGQSYQELRSFTRGSREDLSSGHVLQQPYPHEVTVLAPANNGIESNRES